MEMVRQMAWELRQPTINSGWTIETLLEYTNARVADMELRNQQRFDAQVKSVDDQTQATELRQQQRYEGQTRAIEAAIIAQRAAIDAALVAADRATSKAEQSNERRFESVNEFRQTLSDQASQFITRTEAESGMTRNTERVQEVQVRIQDLASHTEVSTAIGGLEVRIMEIMRRLEGFAARDAVIAEYDRVTERIDEVSRLQTLSMGKGAGLNASWVYILGAIAAIGTIISIFVLAR